MPERQEGGTLLVLRAPVDHPWPEAVPVDTVASPDAVLRDAMAIVVPPSGRAAGRP